MRTRLLVLSLSLLAGCGAAEPPQETETTMEPAPKVEPAATPSPEPSTQPLPLEGLHVLLDPGHNSDNAIHPEIVNALVPDGRGGTKACNTTGTANLDGYPEYAFNWAVAEAARTHLEEAGATVTLTRKETGVGPCIDARGKMAGEIGADVRVSIHANGSDSPVPAGFFAITSADPLNEAQGVPSQDLADHIITALGEDGFTPSTIFGPLTPRTDIATINHSTVPVVMLELAEFRNPTESQAVADPATQDLYGQSIASGIASWWVGDSR